MTKWCIQFLVTLTSDLISRFFMSGAFPQMCLILDQFLWGACLVQSSYNIYVLPLCYTESRINFICCNKLHSLPEWEPKESEPMVKKLNTQSSKKVAEEVAKTTCDLQKSGQPFRPAKPENKETLVAEEKPCVDGMLEHFSF